ncbi:MAG TPA: hypothetical protein VGQ93_13755, partial [Lysobacter sp.]|nr:hypothetical protein [Lysobacter sp.]
GAFTQSARGDYGRCALISPLVGAGRMIRKLPSGEYRLYSRKKDPRTGKRRNLGTFHSRAAAERHEREVQFFKRHG